MKNVPLEEDALLLVEQNFYFLQTGAFFTALAKEHPLFTTCNINIAKKLDTQSVYEFNAPIIKEMLENTYESSRDETVLFEYFVEMNAFRGICMAMVEALRLEGHFKTFIEKKLTTQYEDFFDLLSFVRNVLSHNIHADIYLDVKDYEGTLKRRKRMRREPKIDFTFNYTKDLPEIKAPSKEYGFSSTIDLENLAYETAFLEVLSLWELMMLCELCFNLVIAYKLSNDV